MSELVENKNDSVSISKFYDGKSIFITGAAGFVGVVLLEILLRCCGGIKSIYILLREKKGVSPQERKEEIFNRSLFRQLRGEDRKVFDKVHVVAGDLSLTDMDMSRDDLKRVTEEVTIVFHCAASVSFFKPLQYLLLHNAGGVNNIISLCKKLKRCEVLVYTSTAYSNCNRKLKIEERVYRLPYEAQRFIDAVDNGKEELLQQIVSECQPLWPNHYSFSKCIAENLLIEKASDIPTAIIRPSLIGPIWKGALPGYIEENSSLSQLLIAISKGFLKVLPAHPKVCLDFIPADIVANAHVIAACRLATQSHPSPFVVNCSSHGSYEYRIGEHIHVITENSMKNTIPHIFRYSNKCWVDNHPVKTKLLSLFEHYIPAVGLDLMLLLQGKRPRLVSLYRFLDRVVKISTYFICNSWTYEVGNFWSLQRMVNNKEKEVFYTDIKTLDVWDYVGSFVSGAPFYDWKFDKKSKEERIKSSRRTRMMNVPEDEQIDLLLKDVSEVCTGYGNENMEMLEITVPDAESKGIGRLCGGVATQTSSDDESDLDPLSCRDNCDEDPNWENCSIYNLKIFDSMGTMNPMYFFPVELIPF